MEKNKPDGYIGRPWKYTDEAELKKDIESYLSECTKKGKPPTLSGLALALDISRQTLINYGKDELFGTTVARARQTVESQWEEMLATAKGTGVQFNLKNNFGWRDKSEREITGADGAPLISKIVVDYGDMEE